MNLTGTVITSMIEDIDDRPLLLALLYAMQEPSMARLLHACVELDPAQRESFSILMERCDARSQSSHLIAIPQ